MDSGSWQPDPTRRHELRWWTGAQWSDQVADRGVTAYDPLHPMAPPPAAAPPAAALPTIPNPQTMPPAIAAPTRTGPKRTLLLVGGAVGLVALATAVTFVLTKGDDTSTVSGATTIATTAPATTGAVTTTVATTVPTTAVPNTTAPTTAPPTTTPAAPTVDVLLAALPTDSDVPADWVRYSDATTDLSPESGAGYGFCGGDNAVARAIDHGSDAYVDGPTWDLPDGSWFGVTVYSFPDDAAASSYLQATEQAANGCMTDPVQYDTTEGDLDFFDETVADDVMWHIAEGSAAFTEPSPDADELVRTVEDSYASITLDGYDYSVTMSYLSRLERHGNVVIKFWLYGTWDYQGWDEAAPWAFQPDDAAVDAAAAVVRPVIIERLRTSGG